MICKKISAEPARVIIIFLFLLLTGTENLNAQSSKTKSKHPNILFCIADDASLDHMAAYGRTNWVKTPGFDRVAREGLLFMNAYTPNAKCSPSRASILTGRNPWQLEAAGNHNAIYPQGYTTFMEALEANGYLTGFTGKGWGPGDPGMVNGKRRQLTGQPFSTAKMQSPTKFIFPTDYTANFSLFLKERKKDQPFCFWYGGFEPHRPYLYGSGVSIGHKKLSDIKTVPPFWIDDTATRNDMLDYGLEVEYFDRHLKQMIDMLDSAGELENTLIIVTSDNGMPFPRVKGHVYEFANHLPFALMWKGHIKDSGRKILDYISFIDIAPTVLELTGLSAEKSGMQKIEGRSFTDIIYSTKKELVDASRNYVLIGRERTDVGRPHDEGYPVRGIIKNGFVYTRNYEPGRWPSGNPETGYMDSDDGPTKKSILQAYDRKEHLDIWQLDFGMRPGEELYQVSTDSFCLHNLASDAHYATTLVKLRQQMEANLVKQKDPRVLGNGAIFDQYPFAKQSARNYYERFMKGEISKPKEQGGE